MSVDTRAHITSNVLQERAVLRRSTIYAPGRGADSGYRQRKAVYIKGHSGDDVRIQLTDLGDALRVLKVSAADLGYKPRA